jgi:hypothetical protein
VIMRGQKLTVLRDATVRPSADAVLLQWDEGDDQGSPLARTQLIPCLSESVIIRILYEGSSDALQPQTFCLQQCERCLNKYCTGLNRHMIQGCTGAILQAHVTVE